LIKDFCDSKGVSYPKEVNQYFGDKVGESSKYLRESMLEFKPTDWAKLWRNENGDEGFEINI
jgi:hypothetical protein